MIEVPLQLLGLALCVAGSFLYAGAEIGFYSISRDQVAVDASAGSRTARWARWLMRDDAALLITLLIGNNLVLQLASRLGEEVLAGTTLSPAGAAAVVTAVLTPVVFLFGEALPKDLFYRRPQALTYGAAGFVLVSRVLYWPLERALRLISFLLERLFGIRSGPIEVPHAREWLTGLLAEGKRQGALPARAHLLAENALKLRGIPVSACMTPWDQVLVLREGDPDGAQREAIAASRWTRLPVVDAQGAFLGYVHQLEALAADGDGPVLGLLRPMPVLAADTPVDRALLLMRGGDKRAAVVGDAAAPVGLVTLKDLVEEISGDLSGI